MSAMHPDQTFYLGMTVSNLDGSLDEPEGTGIEECSHVKDEAMTAVMETNAQWPTLDGWVYECRPIAKVINGVVTLL